MSRNLIKTMLEALVLGAGLFFSGCKETKEEYSEQLTIVGTVVETKYIEESYLNPMDDVNPLKDIDPSFDLKKGRFATKQDEEFRVVIDTPIGRFVRDNEGLYKNLKNRKGQKVDVTYKEVYQNTYDDKDGDGKNELVKSVLKDYWFIDAQPKEESRKVERGESSGKK